MKYEYTTCPLDKGYEESLNELGRAGWNLTAVIADPTKASGQVAILKRSDQVAKRNAAPSTDERSANADICLDDVIKAGGAPDEKGRISDRVSWLAKKLGCQSDRDLAEKLRAWGVPMLKEGDEKPELKFSGSYGCWLREYKGELYFTAKRYESRRKAEA